MRFSSLSSFLFMSALVAGSLIPALGQQASVFQTTESFLAALNNAKWECSFNSYPRLRFGATSIDILGNDNKVTSTLTRVTHVEPGLIRVDFNKGVVLFSFSEDLKTFVIANMTDITQFDIPSATDPVALPKTENDPPLEVVFKDHGFWNKMRVRGETMEVLDDTGNPMITNAGFRFLPHSLGVQLPDKGAGMILLSRQRPGGWYLSGRHVGSGVRTEVAGIFRPDSRSKMTNFALRSAHFNRPLLRAGHEEQAYAQERYAIYNAMNVYGETSEQTLYAYNEIGKFRGYERSYDRATDWHTKAYEEAKKGFGNDKPKLLEIGTDLAEAQADKGDFATAKTTLAEVLPHLPSEGDVRIPYTFYKALGAAEFGLRNYPQAATHFAANQKRATEVDYHGYVIDASLDLAACQMAQNQPLEAAASVRVAMDRQDAWTKKNPNYNFDTYKLALACVAIKKWDEAIKYSSLNTRRTGSVAYEEYARLLALLNRGDKPGAQKLAQGFINRFSDGLDEIQIRRDIDAMTVQITAAAAALTPSATAELERVWAQQVESLRKRPLQNYIFARVMVDAIAGLKSGK